MQLNKNSVISRKIRGMSIISKGENIERIKKDIYVVPSQSEKGKKYYVRVHNNIWACTCPDHEKTRMNCKHIWAIKFYLGLRRSLKKRYKPIVKNLPAFACLYCGSERVKKHGIRKTLSGERIRMRCLSCKRTFVEKPFRKMKGDAKIITLVLDLFYKGLSLRKIQNHLIQFYGFHVHYATIYRWIRRYSQLVSEYVDKMQANTSELWHTDEMMVKVNGEWVWLWNIIDSKSRYLISNNVSAQREITDAEKVFLDARKKSVMQPVVVVTDGLQAYNQAIKNQLPNTDHVRLVSIRDKINNNMVERLHNTIRERDKTLRGFKNISSSIDLINGYRAYYNFIRPHMALDGLTPAQKVGIKLELGDNKWLGLIRQANSSIKNI